jgi:hypothetical protein
MPKRMVRNGYGGQHQRLRAKWAPLVERGEVVCGKCRRYIQPYEAWDLSHPGDRKTATPVPWHRSCNRSFAAAVTKPRRRGNPPTTPGPPKIKRRPGWRSPNGQIWSENWDGSGHWGDE